MIQGAREDGADVLLRRYAFLTQVNPLSQYSARLSATTGPRSSAVYLTAIVTALKKVID